MSEDVIVIRGELGKIDYSSYQFFFDNFENSNYREISADELLYSKSDEAFWRVKINHRIFDIVKWTTPKRTRSYPLARCYSLLSSLNQKVSVIPIVKDEGAKSKNPDVLGIDSICLLNLFDIYVVLSYYDQAEKKLRINTKGETVAAITNQKLNFHIVINKLQTIYEKAPTIEEWNKLEIKNYAEILSSAGVDWHIPCKYFNASKPEVMATSATFSGKEFLKLALLEANKNSFLLFVIGTKSRNNISEVQEQILTYSAGV